MCQFHSNYLKELKLSNMQALTEMCAYCTRTCKEICARHRGAEISVVMY